MATRLGLERPQNHQYWVFPIFVDQRSQLCCRLQEHGFDATPKSRMEPVENPKRCPNAETPMGNWDRIVFLPCYPELSLKETRRMLTLLEEFEPS